MASFYEELEKIAAVQSRSSSSTWSSKTVGAPRTKLPGKQSPKAPTVPGKLSPKLVQPAAGYGKRQNYSQPNPATTPETNPAQQAAARQAPPPNVVFGVR